MTNEELVRKIKNGENIAQNMADLYKQNEYLIRMVCKPYVACSSDSEQLEQDLMQEAYFGLSEAVTHYDDAKEVKFSTYMQYWVRNTVRRYKLNYENVIRIPEYLQNQIQSYKQAFAELYQRTGHIPTSNDLSEHLKIDVEMLDSIRMLSAPIKSLEEPAEDENGNETELYNLICGNVDIEADVVSDVYEKDAKKRLWSVVEAFTTKEEHEILKDYFVKRLSMSHIADKYGITLGKVKCLKNAGLQKLRQMKARKALEEKIELWETKIYKNGLRSFKERDYTSQVENIAMHVYDINNRLK